MDCSFHQYDGVQRHRPYGDHRKGQQPLDAVGFLDSRHLRYRARSCHRFTQRRSQQLQTHYPERTSKHLGLDLFLRRARGDLPSRTGLLLPLYSSWCPGQRLPHPGGTIQKSRRPLLRLLRKQRKLYRQQGHLSSDLLSLPVSEPQRMAGNFACQRLCIGRRLFFDEPRASLLFAHHDDYAYPQNLLDFRRLADPQPTALYKAGYHARHYTGFHPRQMGRNTTL
ncbi:MAG: hypothetical protein BWX77_00734 [Bacteroidetes bacterium ADurb.Bin090]|nr:MAG: hypothetical protein BWX77_00734 [Bacteroidetes bacterium ADurb.Bin090]